MGDIYRKPIAGDPLRLSAKLMGQVIDVARGRIDTGANISGRPRDPAVIKVRNDTGQHLDRYAVVGIGAPVILPADNLLAFLGEPIYSGETPSIDSHRGKFAILARAIPSGQIGDAIAAGMTQVRIVGGNSCVGQFADVADGETGFLRATSAGSAQIVWAENDSGAEKYAIVRFGLPRKAKAKITARTESSCGNSGSGTGDTDHTSYTYTLHSVRAVTDGDGCPTFVLDEIDNAIVIDTAFEQNNNRVAVGTIVDAELLTYTDESVSGSGDATTGPAGCRWVFSAGSTESTDGIKRIIPDTGYRYFCVGGQFKEYFHDGSGNYFWTRDIGICCNCEGSGSGPNGSGTDSDATGCCTPPDTICVTFAMTACAGAPYWVARLNGHQIELTHQTGTNLWTGGAGDSLGLIAVITKHVYPDGTCAFELRADANVLTIGGPPTSDGIRITGFASAWSCSPLSLTFGTLGVTIWVNDGGVGNVVTCEASATVVAGACVSVGSGSGQCPCKWQCIGSAWTLIEGDLASCMNPPGGGFVCSQEDAIAYTDGTGADCTPSSTTTANCSDCTFAANQIATTSITGQAGFLSGFAASVDLTYNASLGAFISADQSVCSQNSQLIVYCEGGKWYCGLSASGKVFEASEVHGCNTAIFALDYDTSNTLCPGQAGSMSISVTFP